MSTRIDQLIQERLNPADLGQTTNAFGEIPDFGQDTKIPAWSTDLGQAAKLLELLLARGAKNVLLKMNIDGQAVCAVDESVYVGYQGECTAECVCRCVLKWLGVSYD